MIDFTGQTVLVTGGTGEIGLGIATAFRSAGANVVLTGSRAPETYGRGDFEISQLDVGDDEQVKGFRRTWQDRGLDVLINAAGTVRYKQAEFQIDVFREVVDVNLIGAFHLCTAFHEHLQASRAAGRSGAIVNIASLASLRATANNPAYSASKGGLGLLTATLAQKWGRSGVRVNAIAPGFVESKLTAVTHDNPGARDAIVARTPLARWGTPADIGDCALWLASPMAAFVTGVILPVDGGYSLGL